MSAIPQASGLTYYRRITVRPEAGSLEAHMQDFCHHVKVVLRHADGRIVTANAEGLRLPWNTCPLGAAGVARISGMAAADAMDQSNWPGGRTANCVHAVDLTLVALAHLDDREPFTYYISVTPAMGQVRTARIDRDGELLLEWTVEGTQLTGPGRFAGRSLSRADFNQWAAELTPAEREAATILRRACHIAPSREIDLDTMRVAADSIGADASCHTLQEGVIERARRNVGSSRPELTDADRI
ncbi:MAG: hypothetical protein JWN96_211 [Mycobacterium sp.]|nr:hypothetical protein [Mycobacterium sp.]